MSQFWILVSSKFCDFELCHGCYPILGQILENFEFWILVTSQSYNKPPWRNFDFLSNFDENYWKFNFFSISSKFKIFEFGKNWKIWNLMKLAILVNFEIWKFGIVRQNLIINLDRSRSQLSDDTKIIKFGQILVHKIKFLLSQILRVLGSKNRKLALEKAAAPAGDSQVFRIVLQHFGDSRQCLRFWIFDIDLKILNNKLTSHLWPHTLTNFGKT